MSTTHSLHQTLFMGALIGLLFISSGSQLATATEAHVVYIPTVTQPPLRVAALGDFGDASEGAQQVADLINSWEPELIITLGDNNYPDGEMATFDQNVGQYYGPYIFPFAGDSRYGAVDAPNRFFPALGNHDWHTDDAQPYLDYFPISRSYGNTRSSSHERYYDFVWHGVHFFVLDSVEQEPDGVTADSVQAQWLQTQLSESTAAWQIVYFHHPPYSSGVHGSTEYMQWPFAAWGADAVLAGHDHNYERLTVDGIPYFVNGVGGHSIRSIPSELPESERQFNADFGAILLTISEEEMIFEFYAVTDGGQLIDRYVVDEAILAPRPLPMAEPE